MTVHYRFKILSLAGEGTVYVKEARIFAYTVLVLCSISRTLQFLGMSASGYVDFAKVKK